MKAKNSSNGSNRDSRKQAFMFSAVAIVILFAVIIGVTYAAFQYTKNGTKDNQITTGSVTFVYNETSNGVTITNAFPKSDAEGKVIPDTGDNITKGYFDFNVTSTMGGSMTIPYYVYAVDITGDVPNKLDPRYVKLYLTDASSPENPIEGYEGEVPTFASLDPIKATDSRGEEVQGKKLYYGTFTKSDVKKFRLRMWVSDKYQGGETAETFKLRVDVNTDAEAVEKDTTPPTCNIASATPQKVNKDGDLTVVVNCTDNSSGIASYLTKDNLKVLVGGEEDKPTKVEVQSPIAKTAIVPSNSIQQTIVLSGFSKSGPVSLNIPAGAYDDASGNKSEAMENLATGASVNKWLTAKFHKGTGVSEIGAESLTCDLVDSESCEVELPTITAEQEGYTGYWSTDEESGTEPKSPGTRVTLTKDEDYYSFVSNKVEVKYEIVGGVSAIGESSGKASCEIKFGENSCKITLPSITKNEGYTGAFWGDSAEATSGTNPEEQVDVKVGENGKTFYAIGYKTVNVTYTQVGGIVTEGLDTAGSCTMYGKATDCEITLPNLTPAAGRDSAFWGENAKSTSGKDGGTTDRVSEDTTYYAIGKKEVTATFTPGDGVESIGEAEAGGKCTFYGADTSCQVTLPTIESKKGYGAGKWALTSGGPEIDPGEQVDVSDNETAKYTATAKDTTIPECKLNKVTTPSQPLGTEGEYTVAQKDEEATIVIDCTDTSGSLAKDLALDQVSIKIGEADATATITEEGSGTDITDGREHTYKMKDFSAPGLLVVQIAANAVEDASQNKNIETPITTALTVKAAGQSGVPTNDSGASYSDDTKDSMFEFTHDGTTEYRYIGKTEKNYVNLLGTDAGKAEANLWRIIGVFEEENAGGVKEKRIKLMLDKKLDNKNYSWDQTNSNNWNRPAGLKTALNDLYWNSSSGSCPSGSSTTSCNFASTGLKNVQNKIENMKWHLGAVDSNYYSQNYSTEKFYQLERGSTAAGAGGGTTATGQVGLPYPSDYGYTYANGVDTKCYTNPSHCNESTPSNGWMFNSDYWWTITPRSDYSNSVFRVGNGGDVGSNSAYWSNPGVRPVVYLKSNIGITGGEGTKDEPYTVG